MSRTTIDISGQRIGHWTVGEPVKKGRKIYYRCTCDCGKQKEVYGSVLRTGQSLSCGCQRRLGKGVDLTGQRFDRLVAVEKKIIGNRSYWLCKCDCGGTKLARANDLRYGSVKNCGCHLGVPERRAEALKDYCVDGTYVPGLKRSRVNKNNSSGVTGVNYRPDRGKWRAYIKIKGKNVALGNYDTKEEAIAARKAGEKYYFGKYLEGAGS